MACDDAPLTGGLFGSLLDADFCVCEMVCAGEGRVDGREVPFTGLSAKDEDELGLARAPEVDKSLTVDFPKTERRSMVEMLLFLVGDLDPGGSTIDTLFFPWPGRPFSPATLGESAVSPFVTVDGLDFERTVNVALGVEVGRFAVLLNVVRELALPRVPSLSRTPVGVESRTAGCVAGFRLGGMPFRGGERIFLNASLALADPWSSLDVS